MTELIAYIDPGSGSLIIQAVIATLVAIPFFFRQQISRAVRRFRSSDGSTEPKVSPSPRSEDAGTRSGYSDPR